MSITIGNREIGDTPPASSPLKPVQHDGLESAKRLVKLAAEAGAGPIIRQASS